MKRLLALLTFAFIVISCDDVKVDVPHDQGCSITFGQVSTRAGVTTDNLSEFAVWAEMNNGDDGTPEADEYLDLLTNERVYKSSGNWTYDNTRYWVYNRNFNFFAVHPYSETSAVEKLTLTQDGVSYPGYAVPFVTPASADTDLLVAHKSERTDIGGSFPESVVLTLEHLLTNVTFKVTQDFEKNSEDDFRVLSISITGIKKSGNYYTSRFDEYDDHWVPGSEVIAFDYNEADPTKIRDLTDDELVPFGEQLLMPQTIAGNSVRLTIEYQFHLQNGIEWQNKQRDIYVPAVEWKKGTKVTYTVTLYEDNEISIPGIEVSVDSWGGSNIGGTIIIK